MRVSPLVDPRLICQQRARATALIDFHMFTTRMIFGALLILRENKCANQNEPEEAGDHRLRVSRRSFADEGDVHGLSVRSAAWRPNGESGRGRSDVTSCVRIGIANPSSIASAHALPNAGGDMLT